MLSVFKVLKNIMISVLRKIKSVMPIVLEGLKNIMLVGMFVFAILLVCGFIPTNHQVECKAHPEYNYCN